MRSGDRGSIAAIGSAKAAFMARLDQCIDQFSAVDLVAEGRIFAKGLGISTENSRGLKA